MDNTRPDEELISQNPRDALILRINSLLEEQKFRRAVRISDCVKAQRKKVYEWAFNEKTFQLFSINSELIEKLSEQELKDLADLIYEMSKKYLWLKKAWRIAFFAAIPILGWPFLAFIFSKTYEFFPDYKILSLREWYEKEFGAAFPVSEKKEDKNG